MIAVDGLTVEFGGTILFKDISFQINEKDRIALMEKNGAGKSTLLKIIAGVRNATPEIARRTASRRAYQPHRPEDQGCAETGLARFRRNAYRG